MSSNLTGLYFCFGMIVLESRISPDHAPGVSGEILSIQCLSRSKSRKA